MNILEKIIAHKKQEVTERKALYPVQLLEKSIYFETPVVSLCKYLQREDKSGIIAEFKRRSPSKGDINPYASVERVSIGYMQAGASALSVLTDTQFFGGKNEDLTEARKFNFCPILRKEFIIDEYQLVEARSIGADAVLLIAECLEKDQFAQLARTAKGLGLEVLMEIHSGGQLDKVTPDVDAIGVNNRNLEDFSVSLATSLELITALPAEVVKVSESGLNDPNAVVELRHAGFQGFLIGEHFMRHADPGKACQEFIRRIQHIEEILNNAIA
ncbi:MAG: indole-3-glycerol phosphate synthase TrpC [Phaeodactylibacter sp.]|nr:indole-3-glycerol phosphate synthase TrpC [Phaeodactylibacter sp.]MCB9303901.1 indole-3-glycerol phosphate synthase TrpC [Lewinellaceae bacterium]HQU59134.1 indole-3-glycerol phosphate synthase TrpC [Saprospiraceae bacterium]